MATSNAARQAAYRAKHLSGLDNDASRLNLIISDGAKRALERLSSCYGVTQKAMIEKLLIDAELAACREAARIDGGENAYFAGELKMPVTV